MDSQDAAGKALVAHTLSYSATQGGGLSRSDLLRVAKYLRLHSRRIVLLSVAAGTAAGLAVLAPVLAGWAVNSIVSGEAARSVIWISVAIAGVALAEFALQVICDWQAARIGHDVATRLRSDVYNHVQKLPMQFFSINRTGGLVNRISNEAAFAQRLITTVSQTLVTNSVMVVITFVTMLALSPVVAVAALLLFPLFVVPGRFLVRSIAQLHYRMGSQTGYLISQVEERLGASGALLVRLMGRPDDDSRKFERTAQSMANLGVQIDTRQSVYVTSLSCVSMLAVAMTYGLGGLLAEADAVDAGVVVTLGLLVARLYVPIVNLSTVRAEMATGLASFKMIFDILNVPAEPGEPSSEDRLPDGPLEVRLERVSFSYPSPAKLAVEGISDPSYRDQDFAIRPCVLRGLTLTVGAGERLALIGPSGAGKSTVGALIARLYQPDSGRIVIGGVDLRQLGRETIRKEVGMLPQDTFLFQESIAENLRVACPDADDGQLWQALSAVGLSDKLAELPDRLSTLVSERGYRFSGGERQRIAIARLLLSDPRVIVLDESTSSLDVPSEHKVQRALEKLLRDRTVIVIAHRISTVTTADKVAVVSDGRIAEFGRPSELQEASSLYAETLRRSALDPSGEGVRSISTKDDRSG